MLDRKIFVRSYNIFPGIRGAPVLALRTNTGQHLKYSGAGLIKDFLTAAVNTPCTVIYGEKETPSGGKYFTFWRGEKE